MSHEFMTVATSQVMCVINDYVKFTLFNIPTLLYSTCIILYTYYCNDNKYCKKINEQFICSGGCTRFKFINF